MQRSTNAIARELTVDNSKRRLWQRVVSTLVCVVVFCTTYALIMPAITISTGTYCGYDEHTHDENCYTDGELTCQLPEHIHTLACHSDPNAAVESVDDWASSVSNAVLTTSNSQNVLEIAKTQLGYAESKENYTVLSDGSTVMGYNRYSASNGDQYAAWNISFIEFCVRYAGCNFYAEYMPTDDIAVWMTNLANAQVLANSMISSTSGQLVFFNENGMTYVGISESVDADGNVTLIVGDYDTGDYTDKVAMITVAPENILGVASLDVMLNFAQVGSLSAMASPNSSAVTEENNDLTAEPNTDDNSENIDDNNTTEPGDESAPNGDAPATDDPIDGDSENINDNSTTESGDEFAPNGDAPATDDPIDGDSENINDNSTTESGDEFAPNGDAPATDDPIDGNSENINDNSTTESGDESAPNGDETISDDQNNGETNVAPIDETDQDSGEGDGEGETIGSSGNASQPVDLKQYITGASMDHRGGGTNWVWDDIKNNNPVGDYDEFRVNLSYVLPVGTLANTNQVIYQLPSEIKLYREQSGNVYNNSGDKVGTYVISTDGTITIAFIDEYVQKNSNTSNGENGKIDGSIGFDFSLSESAKDSNNSVDIDFGNNQKIEFHIKSTEKEDLLVEKQESSHNPETGLVEYTIKVKSMNGTGTNVTLSDEGMTNITYYGDIKVVNQSGESVQYTGTPNQGASSFVLTLPKMAAGDEYTITYTGKITDNNGAVSAYNNVKVSAQRENGDELYHFDEVTVKYDHNMVSKTAKVVTATDGTKKVEWTITVGTEGMNLEGWELSDTLNGMPLPDGTQITITYPTDSSTNGSDNGAESGSGDGSESGSTDVEPQTQADEGDESVGDGNSNTSETAVKLPYTFPAGAKGPATITYTTDLEYLPGSNKMSNTATLKKDDKSYSDTEEAKGDDTSAFSPLSKKAGAIETKDDQSNPNEILVDINWKYTIDAKYAIKPTIEGKYNDETAYYWWFEDSLADNQYFTEEQVKALEVQIKERLEAAEITRYKIEILRDGWGEYTARGFKVYVYETLKQGKNIVLDYKSTGSIGNGEQSKQFGNTAKLNDQYVYVSAKYSPVVRKENYTNNSTSDDQLAYDKINETTSDDSKVLKWRFYVTPPENCTEMTVTEVLPEGMSEVTSLTMEIQIGENTWQKSTVDLSVPTGSGSITYYIYKYNAYGDKLTAQTTSYTAESLKEALGLGELSGYDVSKFAYLGSLTISPVTTDGETQTNSTFTITPNPTLINHLLNNGLDMTFTIGVKLEDPFENHVRNDGKNELQVKEYTNSVKVKYKTSDDEEEPYENSDSSTQKITNEDTSSRITKESVPTGKNESNGQYEGSLNVEYTLDVNPKAEDLLEDSQSTLTVIDTVSYGYPSPVVISLLKVEVYEVNSDGETLLDVGEYSYQAQDPTISSNSSSTWYDHSMTLTFKVPDEKHIRIKYTYKFTPTKVQDNTNLNINNTARITEIDASDEAKNNISQKIDQPKATANIGTITIKKIDSANNNKALGGAKFDLYAWNSTENQWDFKQTITTADDGTIKIDNLTSNQAYALVEINAPDGYILDQSRRYFLIHDPNKNEIVAPEDFSIDYYVNDEGFYYITNDAVASTSATAKKVWQDTDGNEIPAPEGSSVTVRLMQTKSIYPLTFDRTTIGASSTVTVTFGHNSQNADQFNKIISNANVGDILHVDLTVNKSLMDDNINDEPGLMEVTGEKNTHLSYTTTDNGDGTTTYHFKYLVTTTEATLKGWTWINTDRDGYDDKSVTVEISLGKYNEVEAKTTVEYKGEGNSTVTLSSKTGWDFTWQDLPLYDIESGTGKILGYYSYSVEETAVKLPESNTTKYTVSYSTDADGNLVVTNKQASYSNIAVEKIWVGSDGNETAAPSGVSEVKVTLYQAIKGNVTGGDSSSGDSGSGDGVTTNLTIKALVGNSEKVFNDTTDVSISGSLITLRVHSPWGDKGEPTVKLGDTTYTHKEVVNKGHYVDNDVYYSKSNYMEYVFEIPLIEDNTNVVLVLQNGDSSKVFYQDPGSNYWPDWFFTYEVNTASGRAAEGGSDTTAEYPTTASGYPYKVKELTLNSSNNWTQTVENLPSTGTVDGKTVEFVYYIVEDEVTDYKATYSTDKNTWQLTPTDSVTSNGTLYVKNAPTDAKTSIKVHKDWKFTDSYEGYQDVTLELYQVYTPIVVEENIPTSYDSYLVYGDGYWKIYDETLEGAPKGRWDSESQTYLYGDTTRQYEKTVYHLKIDEDHQNKLGVTETTALTVVEFTSDGITPTKYKYQSDWNGGTTEITPDELKNQGFEVDLSKPYYYDKNGFNQCGNEEDLWWPQLNWDKDISKVIHLKSTASVEDRNVTASFNWVIASVSDYSNTTARGVSEFSVIIEEAYAYLSSYTAKSATVTLLTTDNQNVTLNLEPDLIQISSNDEKNEYNEWVKSTTNLKVYLTDAIYDAWVKHTGDEKNVINFKELKLDLTLEPPAANTIDNSDRAHTDTDAQYKDGIKLTEDPITINFKVTSSGTPPQATDSAIWLLYSATNGKLANSTNEIWTQFANGTGKEPQNKKFYGDGLEITTPGQRPSGFNDRNIGYEYNNGNVTSFLEQLKNGAEGTIIAKLDTIDGQNYAVINMTVAGVQSTMTLPLANLSTDNIYLALTCDYSVISDISMRATANTLPDLDKSDRWSDSNIQKWATFTLEADKKDDHKWEYTWTGLPLYQYDSSGKITGTYSYYVKEVKVGDASINNDDPYTIGTFVVEYEKFDPIQSGEFKIKNIDKDVHVTLPESGGSGSQMYIFGGLLMIVASALAWIYLKRNKGVDAN